MGRFLWNSWLPVGPFYCRIAPHIRGTAATAAEKYPNALNLRGFAYKDLTKWLCCIINRVCKQITNQGVYNMKFNETVKYNLKRILPILGIAGMTMLPACRGHENEPEPQPVDTTKTTPRDTIPQVQKHDVELKWFQKYYEEITPENIQANLNDPTVANVYLSIVNGGNFSNYNTKGITAIRENLLKPRLELDSTRVFGRGNFFFAPGRALPEDSLWFVQKGWTVNQNQR